MTDAEIARLKRIRLWLASGADDTARTDHWRSKVAQRRAEVDRIMTDAIDRICTTREHAATITRTREVIGDPVPDLDRRAALAALAAASRHLLPEALVAEIMTALQDDVDAAEDDAYNEMRRVPLKPTGDDPTTVAEVDALLP